VLRINHTGRNADEALVRAELDCLGQVLA
jgi:hypothetical protein